MADFELMRSLLYVPGNMPSMLQNVPMFQSDCVMIDLEDSVPYSEKDAARVLVKNFLETYQNHNRKILVRINSLKTKWWKQDLDAILPAMTDGIRLPEADKPEYVEQLDTILTEYEEELGLPIGHFKILPPSKRPKGSSTVSRPPKVHRGCSDWLSVLRIIPPAWRLKEPKAARNCSLHEPGSSGPARPPVSRPLTPSSRMPRIWTRCVRRPS